MCPQPTSQTHASSHAPCPTRKPEVLRSHEQPYTFFTHHLPRIPTNPHFPGETLPGKKRFQERNLYLSDNQGKTENPEKREILSSDSHFFLKRFNFFPQAKKEQTSSRSIPHRRMGCSGKAAGLIPIDRFVRIRSFP